MKSHLVALLICAGAGVWPGIACAQQAGGAPAAATTDQQAAPAAGPEKTICKSETVIGSRFPKKICLTESQWLAQEQDAKRMLERLQGAKLPSSG